MASIASPFDVDLVRARDHWSTDDWARHFQSLGVKPSPVRYDTGGANDVLRYALNRAQKGRCWWMGSQACESRSLQLRDAQIDHVIPQTATAAQLRDAIAKSSYQQVYFDVHDPGNLAVICGACNLEKRDWVASDSRPSITKRIETIEKMRGDVIKYWRQWMKTAKVDDATLKSLTGVGLADGKTKEMYAEIAATMICKLAEAASLRSTMKDYQSVEVESESYRFILEPSTEYLQGVVDSMAEDEAMERRAEELAGERGW